MKRDRNKVTVELRKHKRDDTLQKRRNVPLQADSTGKSFAYKVCNMLYIKWRGCSPERRLHDKPSLQ